MFASTSQDGPYRGVTDPVNIRFQHCGPTIAAEIV